MRLMLLKIIFLVLSILLFWGCSQKQQEEPEREKNVEKMIFPEKDWVFTTPENQGFDRKKLQEAIDTLNNYCFEDQSDELIIIRNGHVIFSGDSIDKSHLIWSCSKSFTSTVLGLLIADGKCKLDDKAAKYEPLLTEFYPNVELKHFASMTSGYNAMGSTRWDAVSEDWSWTPYDPDQPIFAPGTAYAYWDEAMMMNGRVLTKIAGEDLYSYLKRKVTDKIGINDWIWGNEGELDGIPIRNGCTSIEMSAKDLARMGHLYLNKGNWNGNQVLPKDWVANATTNQVPTNVPVAETDRKSTDGTGAYGYNWWVNGSAAGGKFAMPDSPERTYYMSGLNNNVCFVIPEWNLVFVRMGVDGNPPEGKYWVYNKFIGKLKDAMINQ
ncbi:serine hydrolase domain-containing protein [Flexithrix dorotheae]|uniref:serine hydrolase domain-containing protein n=1 Tax=Flexithrix dorotheae TaxID=70993 RepID=UPI0003A8CBD2|nr:serine hydrolase [Flexithrix dorotheae]